MARLLQNNEILSSLLKRFHDIVDFSEKELDLIRRYLFIDQYSLTDYIDADLKDTIEYFRDIIEENKIKDLKGLLNYYDVLIMDSENALKEIIGNTNMNLSTETREDAVYLISDDNSLDNGIGKYTDYYSDLMKYYREILVRYNVNIKQYNETLNSYRQIQGFLKEDINNECSKGLFFLHGSCQMITKVHAQYFVDIDKPSCVYILNDGQHRSIKTRQLDKLCQVKHKGKYKDRCETLNETAVNRAKTHYDLLISQLVTEHPILNEEFKVQFTQWLLHFKLNSSNFMHESGKCDLKRYNLIDKLEGKTLYQEFQMLSQEFYRQNFANKEWTILKSPKGYSWLTTEDPGFSVDLNSFLSLHEPLQPNPNLIDLEKTSVVYFPLTKDYCLRIQPRMNSESSFDDKTKTSIDLRSSSETEFRVINAMTVSVKKKVLISADKETLQQFASPT